MKSDKRTSGITGARLCTDFFEERVSYQKFPFTAEKPKSRKPKSKKSQDATQDSTSVGSPDNAKTQFSLHQAQKTLNNQLIRAIETRSSTKVSELLLQGADVNCKIDEITPLYLAVLYKETEIVGLLLTHGADPNQVALLGNSPLHVAALNTDDKKIEIAELLLLAGADANAQNQLQQTPLHFNTGIVKTHYLKLAKLLLDHGAQLHHMDARGKQPFDDLPEDIKSELLAYGLKAKLGR